MLRSSQSQSEERASRGTRLAASRGQGILEFLLTFVVTVVLLFTFLELAKLAETWFSVRSAARAGLDYALTGNFEPTRCADAGWSLGWPYIQADLADGQADCAVPKNFSLPSYLPREISEATPEEMTQSLQTEARYLSIRDRVEQGALSLPRETALTGASDPEQPGFLQVTICPEPGAAVAQPGEAAGIIPPGLQVKKPSDCSPSINDGNDKEPKFTIDVEFNHRLLNPILSSALPVIRISSRQDGVLKNPPGQENKDKQQKNQDHNNPSQKNK